MIRHIFSILAITTVVASPSITAAQDAGGVISATLLPGWQQADGSHIAGIALDLAPGWKTYWRAPGDAGIPPRFDWSGSRNAGAMQVIWPTPQVMDQNGMTSIGYKHDVVLPIVYHPQAANAKTTLRAEVELGVCNEICVPARLKVSGVLPGGKGARNPAIVAALVDQPITAREGGVKSVSCKVSPLDDGFAIRAEIKMPSAGGREFAVIETDNPMVWVAEATTKRQGGTLIAQTEVSHVERAPFAINRSGVRITVLGRNHAVDIRGCTAG